jgi:hypothetical protein
MVTDVPQVTLQLGSTLNSTQIREGADVYFECSIMANPWITKVSWRHNVSLSHILLNCQIHMKTTMLRFSAARFQLRIRIQFFVLFATISLN